MISVANIYAFLTHRSLKMQVAKTPGETETLQSIGRGLNSSAIHLLRRIRVEDEALGIGPARLSALSVVVFGGPISLNDLARAEQVKPPTMSRIVDALVRDGFVKREVNSADRRAVTISATSKGTRIMHEGRGRREKLLASMLNPLRKSELETLEKAVEIISRILGDNDHE